MVGRRCLMVFVCFFRIASPPNTKFDPPGQSEEYLDEARKLSRREYLKKREEKELALIEKELRDEEFLFGGKFVHVWSGVVMCGVVWMGRSTYAYVPFFFRSRMYIYIPADMELTAEEKQRREVKRKILEMAREKERAEAMGGEHQGYRMPEVSWLGLG